MNKKHYIAAALALGCTLSACDDLMEPGVENLNEFSSLYGTVNQAAHVLGNAYIKLPYPDMPQTDFATDDAVTNNTNSEYLDMTKPSGWTASYNPVNRWMDCYYAIQNINIFLENIDKINWSEDPVYAEMIRDHMRGEALALRGMFHYYLLQAHAGKVDGVLMGVPLHLQSENGSSDFNKPRNTFDECYKQIMEDLDAALELLPERYVDLKSDSEVPAKYRSKGATSYDYNRAQGSNWSGKVDGRIIKTIKAQFSLMAASPAYEYESWDNAAKYATDLINSLGGLSALTVNSIAWFNDGAYIDAQDAKVVPDVAIWWTGRNKTNDPEKSFFPPSLYGSGQCNPTQNLVDAFPMANGYPITDGASGYDPSNPYAGRDPRLSKYILFDEGTLAVSPDPIITGTYNTDAQSMIDGINYENGKSTRTGYYMKKLLREDAVAGGTNAAQQQHLNPRIRVMEMFLVYAEAMNEAQGPTSGSPSAYDVIKRIREYAGITGGDQYLESIKGDKDKMRDMIRNERRINLCFENKRFWDLRRWNVNLNETAKGVKITMNGGKRNYEYINVETRNFESYQIYGPIPYDEIAKFPALKQNDGWK
ncbi:MAG: RagB/SusD family nutrient uptake outer membrane protein [Bacteroidales bacterium]|nr:RagB/SusD family nutrient uptake outer membrane protein [Bacteroidales bacterium]